jgi:HlyD family secretion protein
MNVVEPFRGKSRPLRRYVKVKLEGTVTLLAGDQAVMVEGFTTGGVLIRTELADFGVDAALCFRFTRFELSREIVIREVARFNTGAERTELFEVLVETDEQLGAIIVAFLKNADVKPGDLLRDAVPRPHDIPLSPRAPRGRETHRALAAAIMVCAIGACLWTGYQRLFVVNGYGFVMASDVDPIRAKGAGVFYAYGAAGNRPMHRDELIGLIDRRKGEPISITSPCDCYLGDPTVPSGNPVTKGAVVARVIPPDARVEVTSRMPMSELWAVSVGDMVDLFVPDSERPVPGRISRIERDKLASVSAANDGMSGGTVGVLHITPEEEIGRSLVGSEVPIRIVRASSMVAQLITQRR